MTKLNPKEESVINLILEEEEYQNYFFKKVADIKWFIPLKEKGFFLSEKAPGHHESETKGQFSVPYWNVLDYLERVSQQVTEPQNNKYIKDLLEIIKDVTYNGKDNFRTWWYFTKILKNLPNEVIDLDILELIPVWFESKFETSLQGKEIAKNLLLKFVKSDNHGDIEKAELIIKYITQVRPIPEERKQKAYSYLDDMYIPVIDDYILKEVFKNYSDEIAKRCSIEIVKYVSDSISKILKKEYSLNDIAYNNVTMIFLLKEIGNAYELKVYEFNKILDKEELYTIRQEIKRKENILEEAKSVESFKFTKIDTVRMFVNTSKKKVLIKYPGFREREVELSNFLKYLYYSLYNKGTYTSLYEKEPLITHNVLSLFNYILNTIISIKVKETPDDISDILDLFLKDKYLYFRKFAFYIIGRFYEGFNKLFWEYISLDNGNTFLKAVYFGDEIGHILKKAKDIDDKRRELIEKKMEEEVSTLQFIEDENFIKRWKQRFYKALAHDEYFNKKYLEIKSETGFDPELRPAIRSGETKWGPGPSPLSEEDIFNMSNRDLSVYLKEFKTKDPWDGPTVGGLSEKIKNIVQKNPQKFVDDMEPFIDVNYNYIYYILWGLNEAWKNKTPFDWNKLFEFIYNYIDRKAFWENEFKTEGDFIIYEYRVVVSTIGSLIQDGCQKDENAFGEELISPARNIILLILQNLQKDEDEKELHDPITHALNSEYGTVLTALIYLALYSARMSQQNSIYQAPKWNEELKQAYTKSLTNKVNEAYTLLGQYLPNFHYLDAQWTESQIKELENEGTDVLWECFMIGYLYGDKVYNNIYGLMYNHYLKAIEFLFNKDNIKERLVQHVAIEYLRGIRFENKEPLFKIIINKWDFYQIEELIRFFWMQRDYIKKTGEEKDEEIISKEEFRNKILDFWKIIYERFKLFKDKLLDEEKKILSSVSRLAVFLPEINDQYFNWLILSAPYIHEDYASPFLIEYLDTLKDKGNKEKTSIYIGKIFRRILDSFTPDFDKSHIISIVEFIYNSGSFEAKELADEICNIYGSRGDDLLRELYEKNNR